MTTKIRQPRRTPRIKGKKPERKIWSPRFHPLTGEDQKPDHIAPMATINSLGGLCGFRPGTIVRKPVKTKALELPRDIRSIHPVCHNDNVVMGGPQRPDFLIGPGSGLPTNWRG